MCNLFKIRWAESQAAGWGALGAPHTDLRPKAVGAFQPRAGAGPPALRLRSGSLGFSAARPHFAGFNTCAFGAPSKRQPGAKRRLSSNSKSSSKEEAGSAPSWGQGLARHPAGKEGGRLQNGAWEEITVHEVVDGVDLGTGSAAFLQVLPIAAGLSETETFDQEKVNPV